MALQALRRGEEKRGGQGMKRGKQNILQIIQDGAEYFLHITTLVGPLVLFGYAIWFVISKESWNAALFVVIGVSLLAVNVFMRTPPPSGPPDHRRGAG